MISLRVQAEKETKAALAGAIAALEGHALSTELAVVPMSIYGDALRLGLEAPARVRSWATEATAAHLDEIVRASGDLLRDVGSRTRGDADDAVLATKLSERDVVESVLTAVRRVWLPRPVAQLEAYPPLVARLRAWDHAAAAVVSRATATSLLGVRAAFGAAWLHGFPDEEVAGGDDGEDLAAALRGTRPSRAVVARYVEGGLRGDFVEGAASADADFADELADTICGMCAIGEAGLLARAWLKRFEKTVASKAFAYLAPRIAHAAATGDEASSTVVHRLGALFRDVDAQAQLVVSDREVTLEVDFEPGAIACVELGTEQETPSTDAVSCRLVLARSAAGVRIRVRASSGQEIHEELSFQTEVT